MLKVENLSHTFGEKILYKNISFELFKSKHMCLVGQNGSGKSTLLNILTGKIIPDKGNITWLKNIKLGYIDQYIKIDEDKTVFEYMKTAFIKIFDTEQQLNNLYAQINIDTSKKILNRISALQIFLEDNDYYQIESTILKVADGLGINTIGMKKKLKELSADQRTKIILAKLLLEKPDLLLLDEPTNFLDKEHIQWLTEYLQAFKNSFVIISHDFNFLDKVTNCICDIEFCTFKKYKGRSSKFLEQKNLKREEHIKSFAAQQKQIKKLEDYITKNKARASTAAMAKSRQKKLDKIDKLSKPENLPRPSFYFNSLPIHHQKALIAENLEIGYKYPLLPKINFSIEAGEKTVITGFNGIGKSTLLKTLVREINPISEQFKFADNTKIAYFEQDLKFTNHAHAPIKIISEKFPELQEKQIRKYLAQCALKSKNAIQPISTLSGGEQSKIKICILMLTKANILILDEPTNHLDNDSKDVLKSELENWSANLILVSHEKNFYNNWANKIIDIENY